MSLGTSFYRLVKRLIPLDSTHVFLLAQNSLDAQRTAATRAEFSCRILNKEDLQALSVQPAFSISAQFLADAETYQFQVVGVMSDNDVAGLCCFARNDVPAQLNTGGSSFKGVGLRLPTNAVYLFKVFVRNEYRGRRLVGEIVNFALQSDDVALNRAIITTTDVTNDSFSNAIKRLGFERVGRATEAVILGKHWFKLPPPIKLIQASSDNTKGQSITLVKPTD